MVQARSHSPSRRPLIVGNWKMQGLFLQIQPLVTAIVTAIEQAFFPSIEVVILPPFVYLSAVKQLLGSSSLELGAQDLDQREQGPVTGAIAASMLVDVGCQYVLIGHSERRCLFGEGSTEIAAKYQAALCAGLCPILCVGETRSEQMNGRTNEVIRQQIEAVLQHIDIGQLLLAQRYPMVIAYEPVWAIGSGTAATESIVQSVHAFIRDIVAFYALDLARTLRILYGGSMNMGNAEGLLALPDIDGGLIGGASLRAAEFISICTIALNHLK